MPVLLNIEWYKLGLDYLTQYNELIYSVTPADLQRVAAHYLNPARCTIVVSGPPQ